MCLCHSLFVTLLKPSQPIFSSSFAYTALGTGSLSYFADVNLEVAQVVLEASPLTSSSPCLQIDPKFHHPQL